MDGARELAWAVTRVGRSQGETRGEFAELVRVVEHEWGAIFPRRLGYTTEQEIHDAEVRLTASRGDFVARVALCCAPERQATTSSSAVIRLLASADSREVQAARAAGKRAVDWASWLATSVGVLISLGFCWLTIGAQSAPLIVGLMLTVIVTVLPFGGHLLGVRVGEKLARRYAFAAERRREHDPSLRSDLERWNSLGRQLRRHRRALARGLAGTPFRRA